MLADKPGVIAAAVHSLAPARPPSEHRAAGAVHGPRPIAHRHGRTARSGAVHRFHLMMMVMTGFGE